MKIFVMIVVLLLSVSNNAVAETEENYAAVDREMIQLLTLNQDQASAYREIIQQQRQLFLALKAGEWRRELALYHQTFTLLRPVLTSQQHARFVGIINSVIEYTEDKEILAMGD